MDPKLTPEQIEEIVKKYFQTPQQPVLQPKIIGSEGEIDKDMGELELDPQTTFETFFVMSISELEDEDMLKILKTIYLSDKTFRYKLQHADFFREDFEVSQAWLFYSTSVEPEQVEKYFPEHTLVIPIN